MIIADESIDARIITAIRTLPMEVYAISEHNLGISDEEIVQMAKETGKIILTRDKDFGDLVFSYHLTDISVILLRYDNSFLSTIIKETLYLLSDGASKMKGRFATITNTKVRIRTI